MIHQSSDYFQHQYFSGMLIGIPNFLSFFFSFFINPHPRTCLLIFGERVREGEGEKPMWDRNWLAASCTCPNQGMNPQPRHVPPLGIKPTIFQFTGWCSNHLSHNGLIFRTSMFFFPQAKLKDGPEYKIHILLENTILHLSYPN